MDVVSFLQSQGQSQESMLSKHSETGMHAAALGDAVMVLSYMSARGCALTSKTQYGETMLHYAARGGALKCIHYLLEHNANVDEVRRVFFGDYFSGFVLGA